MTAIARGAGDHGALFDLSGTWSINATVSEDIYFQEAGAAMDLTGLAFKLTLRANADSDTADYTLSTAAGTLSITTDDDDVEILRITVTPGTFTDVGEFVADLASQDSDDKVTHWAHGILSLRRNPVEF